MTDLFSQLHAIKPTKIGQANGEFLGRLATMPPAQRRRVTPRDFPYATPSLVVANVAFHGGKSA